MKEQKEKTGIERGKIGSFEDLECWKEAVELAVDIYRMTKGGEISKDFSLRDQIRSSSVSIAANISEGKERETVSEFIRFLYISKGSAGELRTHLIIAHKIGYLSESEFTHLSDRLGKIGGMIGKLIRVLKREK